MNTMSRKLGAFLAAWAALTAGLITFLGNEVTIPPEEILNYRVGSAAITFFPAAAVASLFK